MPSLTRDLLVRAPQAIFDARPAIAVALAQAQDDNTLAEAVTLVARCFRRHRAHQMLAALSVKIGLKRLKMQGSRQDEAARVIQNLYRSKTAWGSVIKLIREVYEKRVDPATGFIYYFNKASHVQARGSLHSVLGDAGSNSPSFITHYASPR